jgi:hypothetical protein
MLNNAVIRTCAITAIVVLVICYGCSNIKTTDSVPASPSPIPTQTDSENKMTSEGPRIQYEGISFEYDPKVLGNVTMETIAEHKLENPTDKPDIVAPRHVQFEFENGPKDWEGFLKVYPLSEFPNMYEVQGPASVEDQKRKIEDLKAAIRDKNFRIGGGQIPSLLYCDCGQDFQTNVKLSEFENGRGIFFVTHISIEFELINNEHLRYVFEGITNDGQHYVLAELPVAVDFLPAVSPDEFEGVTLSAA